MKRFTVLAAAVVAAACAESPTVPSIAHVSDPALAAAFATVGPAFVSTATASSPISLTAFVTCAADGAGEIVALEGRLHVLSHVTQDGAGGVHVKTHSQPQNVTGTGLTTGLTYQGTGVTQESFQTAGSGLPYTFTTINNFRIIGQGPDNNWLVHVNSHVTVNANGSISATVDNTSIECR